MGNTFSHNDSKNANYKVFKVTGVRHKEDKKYDWINILLDDCVEYEDGNYKNIDLEKTSTWIMCRKVGDYVEIDINMTKSESHMHTFKSGELRVCETVRNELVTERTDSNGGTIRELGEEHIRESYTASIEQQGSRYANNHAWTKQTSWDMPPNWK